MNWLSKMSVRAFPRTRDSPQKRILLIPILLIFGGWGLTFIPGLGFIGAIISMTGVLTVFLVGTVFADLWSAARRTKQIIDSREDRGEADPEDINDDYDPFEERMGKDASD